MNNADVVAAEIAWFRTVLGYRFNAHGGVEDAPDDPVGAVPPPALPADPGASPYAAAVSRWKLDPAARLVLILSFIPHVAPAELDPFLIHNQSTQRRFTEFGGILGQVHGGLVPTVETALFLLAGDDLALRLSYRYLFAGDHPFVKEGVLNLDHRHRDEPQASAILALAPEFITLLTTGQSYDPPFSQEFPASRISTRLDWSDLVLDRQTRQEVEDICAWMRHGGTLMTEWGLARRLKPGFRSLFFGPPGTGKTLTACLLGKASGRPVYRVDLSRVVSKYIGETEKNLAGLFDRAENRDWILFFDEADALFGRRGESRSANDRASNQQVAYLLQRIEDFPGVVILATNLRGNLDDAFARRFQSMIAFPMPGPEERRRLWRDTFAGQPLAPGLDLNTLADRYELAGGAIVNVLRHACLRAIERRPAQIFAEDLTAAIRRELHKEGRFGG